MLTDFCSTMNPQRMRSRPAADVQASSPLAMLSTNCCSTPSRSPRQGKSTFFTYRCKPRCHYVLPRRGGRVRLSGDAAGGGWRGKSNVNTSTKPSSCEASTMRNIKIHLFDSRRVPSLKQMPAGFNMWARPGRICEAQAPTCATDTHHQQIFRRPERFSVSTAACCCGYCCCVVDE